MSTVKLRTLVDFLDHLLRPEEVQDYCPNGLQVEGKSEIRKLVTGVSACQELFDRAVACSADSILTHHGLFWNGASPVLAGVPYRRLRTLITSETSLLSYHLPLDRHPDVGNNAIAARELGLSRIEPFGDHKGVDIGCRGSAPKALTAGELADACHRVFGQPPAFFPSTPERGGIREIALISGAAQDQFYRAIDLGLDAFITGEISEWVVNLARESKVTYYAAGHYATETLGVKCLAELVSREFGIETEFIDVPNPV